MSEVINKNHHRNWLLRGLLPPEWLPKQWQTVLHVESNKRALVLTIPVEPKEIFELAETQNTRPTVCDILLGEELINAVDVSLLKAL